MFYFSQSPDTVLNGGRRDEKKILKRKNSLAERAQR